MRGFNDGAHLDSAQHAHPHSLPEHAPSRNVRRSRRDRSRGLRNADAAGGNRPRPTVQLTPCSVPNSTTDARCGTYPVFEDRVAKSGRTISLNILVLPALTESAAPDPIFVLAGGPGQGAASGVTREVVEYFRPMRSRRDVVFVDQRGTGASHPLQCGLAVGGSAAQSSFGDLLPADRIRACRQALERIADLRLYTTPIAMDDLDEVRDALGYATINLYGVSYGSLAAMQYLRQHPARVRSLALAGVATGGARPRDRRLCRRRGVSARVSGSEDGRRRRLRPTRSGPGHVRPSWPGWPGIRARAHVTGRLRGATAADALHPAVGETRAAGAPPRGTGGLGALRAGHVADLTGGSAAFAMGMYLTVNCSESVAAISEDDIVHEARGSFVGEDRVRVHMRACQEWPRGRIPDGFYAPVTSPAPVLMLSGELDAATPAHFAGAAARSLPNSRQILIRNAAHWYFEDCLRDLMADFIAKGSARDLDARCVETLRRPPFVTQQRRCGSMTP
jgi:pimeloyl-ACP methyl ester carboxylesterase